MLDADKHRLAGAEVCACACVRVCVEGGRWGVADAWLLFLPRSDSAAPNVFTARRRRGWGEDGRELLGSSEFKIGLSRLFRGSSIEQQRERERERG
jgi:hypothetical protein